MAVNITDPLFGLLAFSDVTTTSLRFNQTATRNILVDTYNRLSKFSLPFSLLTSLSFAIAMLSLFVNSVVFSTVRQVPMKTLRSKTLVMSTLAGDMLFPLVSSAEIFKFVLLAYGITDRHVMTCWEFFGNSLALLAQYSQLISTLALATDRAYAVIAPITYHMLGYPRAITALILGCTWLLPSGIFTTYAIVQYFVPMRTPAGICYKLKTGTNPAFQTLQFALSIAFSLTTFATYTGILVALKLRKLKNKAASSVRSETLKKTISLVITYFSILLTSMALYLPAPFFKIFVQFNRRSRLSRVDTEIILRCLANLYYLNAVVDPIIFASRIQSIRNRLPNPLRGWLCIRTQEKARRVGSTGQRKTEPFSITAPNS